MQQKMKGVMRIIDRIFIFLLVLDHLYIVYIFYNMFSITNVVSPDFMRYTGIVSIIIGISLAIIGRMILTSLRQEFN